MASAYVDRNGANKKWYSRKLTGLKITLGSRSLQICNLWSLRSALSNYEPSLSCLLQASTCDLEMDKNGHFEY